MLAQQYRVVVAADGDGSAQRLHELLLEHGLDLPVVAVAAGNVVTTRPGGHVVVAPLHRGCTLPNAKVAIVAESDLTGRRRSHRTARPPRRESARFFEDLKAGNYVVHHQHGVGKYEGMVKRTIGGVERDYLLIAYKGGDKLYVPSDQIDTLRQYVGGETPTLHRLGGSDFAKAKSRVRSAVREIAQELVVLYQKRVHSVGHSFGPDTPWQHEMEEAFPYVETPDQRVAIDDVKLDMERAYPMDRLVCGDVGFGKTEVAIRAAFKAIQEGKQVAVLAPTTLLANQHGNTFADRFAGYPIRVEVLSRFLTNAQAKKVIDGLRTGEVDCVIGTHRLLTNDVTFKDLGLLVVDEEQRFGVQHKEAMKKLKVNVDIITLTATPIPRTLEMSLVGIRDLSLLQTPPADRQPILTYVGEYDERVAIEAIRRELLREGQVFWVHNRVRSIETAAARLRQLVPEARIAVAHGQIDEGTLEQVVVDFSEGRYDVLVCTTIIESGIDMPTVNTLVVERSDLLGLGQMHQLRGRVGRSGQRAYAYLFHPRDRTLTEEAYERLRTIGESTELGSGFRIAMRDLEIRGAGNLLGEAQSGHIAAVGYDLYCQMVTEAVAEMKGEPIAQPSEIKLDVPTDAFLPADYVTKEELRLEAYRRLAAVTSESEVADIRAEWEDRYGPLPEPAEALLMVGSLRAECNRLGITDMQITGQSGAPVADRAQAQRVDAPQAARHATRSSRRTSASSCSRSPRGKDPATFLVTFLRELIPALTAGRPVGSAGVSRRAVAVPILLLAGAATGCSAFSDNDAAARVADFELSQDELDELLVAATPGAQPDDELEAVAARPPAACSTRGSSPGSWRSTSPPRTRPSTPPRPRRPRTRSKPPTPKRGRRHRPRCRTSRSSNRPRSRPGPSSKSRRRPTPSCGRSTRPAPRSRGSCAAPTSSSRPRPRPTGDPRSTRGRRRLRRVGRERVDRHGLRCQRWSPAVRPDEQLRSRLRPRVRRGGPGRRDRRAGRAGPERVRLPHHRPATIGSGRPRRAGRAVHRGVATLPARRQSGRHLRRPAVRCVQLGPVASSPLG